MGRDLTDCSDDRWRVLIDRVLGPEPREAGEPTAAELVAAEARELTDPSRRREVAAYLAQRPQLADAIRAGLAEADRIEGQTRQPLRVTRAPALAELVERLGGVFRGVLQIGAPPQLAAAATEGAPSAPVPEDRQVLLDDPASLRLVYHRQAGQAVLMAFAAPGAALGELLGRCWLDDRELSPERIETGIYRFALGPAARLDRRTIRLELSAGQGEATLQWLLEARRD